MAEWRENNPGKENYDKLVSLFRTGTEVKQWLLDFYLIGRQLHLLDWLITLNNNFLQFEDVKRALRQSSTVNSKDLSVNTINTILSRYCFDMFWDCCLKETNLEDLLNTHKDELYRNYVDILTSKGKNIQPFLPPEQHIIILSEHITPVISKDQWDVLFKEDDIPEEGRELDISASRGITVSSLDNNQHMFILSTVCPLFKSCTAVSEGQIQISIIAALDCEVNDIEFVKIWNNMELHIVTIGSHCKLSDYFKRECKSINQTIFNRTLVQDNRKCILQDAFNSLCFIMDRDFCNRVRRELDIISEEENLNRARTLCGREISVSLINGKYPKGAYSHSVIQNAENNMKVLDLVYSKQIIDTGQQDTEVKIETDEERCKRYNHLKLVQLIIHIAKDVVASVLKGRLPNTNLGYAFNGMKNRLLLVLDNHERQKIYPDGSNYSGDLTDLDISTMYKILRNINTMCPHKEGWGNLPRVDDRSTSANIDRIRVFKNMYVSHCSKCAINEEDFLLVWTEIRQCIIELGGSSYICRIDFLLTSEINPVIEKELSNTLERAIEAERQNELHWNNIKEELDNIKQQLNMISTHCMKDASTTKNSSGIIPLKIKIEGDGIPSVEEIEERKPDLTTEVVCIKSVTKGSLIICVDVSSSAFHHVGIFLEVIDTLVSGILQRRYKDCNGHTTDVIIFLDFMDTNNEPLAFRKQPMDIVGNSCLARQYDMLGKFQKVGGVAFSLAADPEKKLVDGVDVTWKQAVDHAVVGAVIGAVAGLSAEVSATNIEGKLVPGLRRYGVSLARNLAKGVTNKCTESVLGSVTGFIEERLDDDQDNRPISEHIKESGTNVVASVFTDVATGVVSTTAEHVSNENKVKKKLSKNKTINGSFVDYGADVDTTIATNQSVNLDIVESSFFD